jgi:hypothetical protein
MRTKTRGSIDEGIEDTENAPPRRKGGTEKTVSSLPLFLRGGDLVLVILFQYT